MHHVTPVYARRRSIFARVKFLSRSGARRHVSHITSTLRPAALDVAGIQALRDGNAMMRIAIGVLALLLTACNDEGSPTVPAATLSYWKIAYSPNMPAQMFGTEGNWYFDFPNQNGVHYVYKAAPTVRVGQTITMHLAITGKGNFVPTEGTAAARVRLFLQQRGDTLTAQEPYKRWWSVTYVELHEGEFTLTASLSPASGLQCSASAGPRCRTSSARRYPSSRMLALRSAARSLAMAFMSRAGTPVLSSDNTQFRNERMAAGTRKPP